MYGSVIATFDFPIYKTDEAIKHEQDSLLRQFQPYYTVNSNVGNEQIKRFSTTSVRAFQDFRRNTWNL